MWKLEDRGNAVHKLSLGNGPEIFLLAVKSAVDPRSGPLESLQGPSPIVVKDHGKKDESKNAQKSEGDR